MRQQRTLQAFPSELHTRRTPFFHRSVGSSFSQRLISHVLYPSFLIPLPLPFYARFLPNVISRASFHPLDPVEPSYRTKLYPLVNRGRASWTLNQNEIPTVIYTEYGIWNERERYQLPSKGQLIRPSIGENIISQETTKIGSGVA